MWPVWHCWRERSTAGRASGSGGGAVEAETLCLPPGRLDSWWGRLRRAGPQLPTTHNTVTSPTDHHRSCSRHMSPPDLSRRPPPPHPSPTFQPPPPRSSLTVDRHSPAPSGRARAASGTAATPYRECQEWGAPEQPHRAGRRHPASRTVHNGASPTLAIVDQVILPCGRASSATAPCRAGRRTLRVTGAAPLPWSTTRRKYSML